MLGTDSNWALAATCRQWVPRDTGHRQALGNQGQWQELSSGHWQAMRGVPQWALPSPNLLLLGPAVLAGVDQSVNESTILKSYVCFLISEL